MSDKAEKWYAGDGPSEAVEFVSNRWSRRVVQPVLLSLVVTAAFTVFLALSQLLSDGRPWVAVWPFYLVVALEAAYTTQWLGQPEQRLFPKSVYRLSELIGIVFAARVVSWAVFRPWLPIESPWDYLFQPGLMLDVYFSIMALTAVGAWFWANRLAVAMEILAVTRAEAEYYLRPQQRSAFARPSARSRGVLVAEFFKRWVGGGMVVVFLASMTTFDVGEMVSQGGWLWDRLGLMPAVLLALVTYFVAGFLLLGQARLAALNGRWLANGVQKQEHIERNWNRAATAVVGGIALAAMFLPIGSTFALARILEAVLGALAAAALFIGYGGWALLGWFFSLLATGEAPPPTPSDDIVIVETPPPMPSVEPAPPPDPRITAAFSTVFWLIIAIIVVEAVLFWAAGQGYRLHGETIRGWWARLGDWWRDLWGGVRRQVGDLGDAIRLQLLKRAAAEEAKGTQGWRFLRLGALSPRQLIRYFYLSIVRRAADSGLPRGAGQTPEEYAAALRERWPEAADEVEILTDAFLKARYSPADVSATESDDVKQHWKQVRRRVRRGRGDKTTENGGDEHDEESG